MISAALRAAAVLLLVSPLIAEGVELPTPGVYTMTVRVSYCDPTNPRVQERIQCITADQFAGQPQTFMAVQPDDHECEVLEYRVARGKMDLEMVCTTPEGPAKVTGAGEYSTDGFEFRNTTKVSVGGLDMIVTTVARAARSGDCQ
jgi:hypothetical protein